MKQRILSLVMACGLCLCLIGGPWTRTQAISEITDPVLTEAVEVLTGLGIISGYSDGTFRPTEALTRAQFCKLAVLVEGHGDKVNTSAYRTLFSDVPGSGWAAPYINLAYSEGLMSGYGNGMFGPNDPVTTGQAVTVVLHILGYTTAEIGPFWPEDDMEKATTLGLLEGISKSAEQTLTRGDAARLLYALLDQTTMEGKDYLTKLSTSMVEDVVLLDNDAEAEDGTLHTAQVYTSGMGLTYYLQSAQVTDQLVGRRGTLLLDKNGKVCGFVPDESTSKMISIDTVSADKLTDQAGKSDTIPTATAVVLDNEKRVFGDCWYELEGRSTATVYYTTSGTVDLVVVSAGEKYSGVLLTGYYENASPNATSPTSITMLGIELPVAEGGAEHLTNFAVGSRLTVELNGAGEVIQAYNTSECSVELAGVLESADSTGCKITLTCGLTATGGLSTQLNTAQAMVGSLVRVTSSVGGTLSIFTLPAYTGKTQLDLSAGTLGSLTLAENLKIYDQVSNGSAVEIEQEDVLVQTVPANQILYMGTNGAGQVNVLLLEDMTGDAYRYGLLRVGTESGGSGNMSYTNVTISVENADGTSKAYLSGATAISDKTVGGVSGTGGGRVAGTVVLTKAEGVLRSAFDGTESAVVDGIRIPISEEVQVYNTQTEKWMTLATAKSYTDHYTVYYSGTPGGNAKIRVIFIE